MTDSLSSSFFAPFQLDGTAIDPFDFARVIGELNVADDLRRGRGVRLIMVSTSGLSGRAPPRSGGFFGDRGDRTWAGPGTGGSAFSEREGVWGWETLPEGERGVLGLRGRGELPKTALATIGLFVERVSASTTSDIPRDRVAGE